MAAVKMCLNCLKNIKGISDSEFCGECQGNLTKCEYSKNGCLFVDINKKKCAKHALYFCEYQTKCCRCDVDFVGGSFFEHFSSSSSCRKIIQATVNSIARVTPNINTSSNYILFSSDDIGIIVCPYKLTNSYFKVYLLTSLPTHELKNFKCSIELIDPQTKYIQILTPQIEFNSSCDWYVNEKMDDFSSWDSVGIDVKLNISKI